MNCSNCHESISPDAAICPKCGQQLSPAAQSSTVAEDSVRVMTHNQPIVVRPWVRYWARAFDINIFSFIVGFLLGVLFADAVERLNSILLGIVVALLWVFVESLLLTIFQTTPGKWLLKTKVRRTSGLPISFGIALERSFTVWWRGLGIGFPIAALITCVISYGRLTSRRKTAWDEELGFEVTHETIGVTRVTITVACFVLFAALMYFSRIASQE